MYCYKPTFKYLAFSAKATFVQMKNDTVYTVQVNNFTIRRIRDRMFLRMQDFDFA